MSTSNLRTNDSSLLSFVDTSSHAVSKLEADLYYRGIRGQNRLGPKLIYRSSKDVFTPPSEPERYFRTMELLPATHHDKLGQNNLWETIRSKVVELLDKREIYHTSVDLTRFRWVERNADYSSKTIITPVTIWVGVVPHSLIADVAFDSCNDIIELLKAHDIIDIDVAYRESSVDFHKGPELYAPVSNFHLLKHVIDPLTSALGMPIAGLKTPDIQGTLGFYFRVGEALYGVTARHVLFPQNEPNALYSYHASRPKKEVILLGDEAFSGLTASIHDQIAALKYTVGMLDEHITQYMETIQRGGLDALEAESEMAAASADRARNNVTIEALKTFFVELKRNWYEPHDRVIGHVVWAPPISASKSPLGYTKDVCVIKLDEKKFCNNFKGNVIDLGTEIKPGELVRLMSPRGDLPRFNYPLDRLLKLRDFLSTNEMHYPSNGEDDPSPLVLKRGPATQTTIGRLTRFESHVRHYGLLGNFDSVKAAIYPYDRKPGPFSGRGDSGSVIADSRGKFFAVVNGSAGTADFADITYGIPVHFLWNEVIKPEFPGASLDFDIPED